MANDCNVFWNHYPAVARQPPSYPYPYKLSGTRGVIAVKTGEAFQGEPPRKVASIIKDWCLNYQNELLDNWDKAQRFEPLNKIQGANRD